MINGYVTDFLHQSIAIAHLRRRTVDSHRCFLGRDRRQRLLFSRGQNIWVADHEGFAGLTRPIITTESVDCESRRK